MVLIFSLFIGYLAINSVLFICYDNTEAGLKALIGAIIFMVALVICYLMLSLVGVDVVELIEKCEEVSMDCNLCTEQMELHRRRQYTKSIPIAILSNDKRYEEVECEQIVYRCMSCNGERISNKWIAGGW